MRGKCREAIRLLERTGDYWQVHIARYQIAASMYRLGDLQGALEESKLNYRSGIELGDEQASGIILDIWVRATGGVISERIMKPELERQRHDAQGRAQVLFAEGVRLLGVGNVSEARSQIQNAIDVVEKAGVAQRLHIAVLVMAGDRLATASIEAGAFNFEKASSTITCRESYSSKGYSIRLVVQKRFSTCIS